MTVPSSSTQTENSKLLRAHPLSSYVPILAIVVIVLLTALFAWAITLERRDEQRNELIRNALWVEQSLSFQLQSLENNLLRTAEELEPTPGKQLEGPALQAQLQHYKQIHPELLRVVIWSQDGKAELVRPPGSPLPARDFGEPARSAWLPASYSEHYAENVFDLVIPIFSANTQTGYLQATFSLKRLLSENVPWWIAEHYKVSLLDNNDKTLAERSQAPLQAGTPQHFMSVDPPLHGLRLLLSPYRNHALPTFHLLLAAVVGLALLAVINLGIQHHYVRRRRAAEHALLEEQAFRRAMEASMVTGMRARDLQGRILYVNPAFCRLVGMEQENIIGLTPPMPWWEPENIEESLARRHRLNRAPSVQVFETRFKRSDGVNLDIQVFESPLIDSYGTQVGWIGSIIDISSRKQAEAQASTETERLHHTAKLISMGEMASTLAHELNQPLAAIASYAAGTLNLLDATPLDRQLLIHGIQSLAEQTRRAGLIIHRIHDFVRKRDPQFHPLNLQSALQAALTLAKPDLKKHAIVTTVHTPAVEIQVLGDKVLLEQVIFNLIRNAAEAMSELAAARRELEVSLIQEDERALIKICDQGPGVDPDIIADIFQAFTTTKSDGLGIGLNVCRSIIELHHGQLWFENNAVQGATFLFSLPLSPHD